MLCYSLDVPGEMSELTQVDWDWLQKLATIYHSPGSHVIPSDVEMRLLDLGYVRKNNHGQIVITAVGRRAIKARDGGENY